VTEHLTLDVVTLTDMKNKAMVKVKEMGRLSPRYETTYFRYHITECDYGLRKIIPP